jgi:membrane protease YdiL (CAAX protease family)
MDHTKNDRTTNTGSRQGSVWIFFLLVFLLAAPFYLLGALYGAAWEKIIPINLPLSAVMFFVPTLAAVILTYRKPGAAGVNDLFKRAVDCGKIKNKAWYLVILGLWPALMLLEYGLMRLMGVSLPSFEFSLWLAPVFLIVFFIGGIGEELGWTGYATDRLQDRRNALQTSLIIGVVWALLHVTADVQAQHTGTWILWQRLGTIILRIITVWLYNNTGKSVFATVLFHDMVNVSVYMFPNYGSHYNPSLSLLISAVMAAIIIVVWGPATLARYRYGRLSDPGVKR